jgi:hypothetical protein
VPAAAVIPAPIAYINVVAVKKLVVGFWACSAGRAARRVAGEGEGGRERGFSSFFFPLLFLSTGWACLFLFIINLSSKDPVCSLPGVLGI